MNNQDTNTNYEADLRSSRSAKFAALKVQAAPIQSAALVTRLLYAILIVGFLGYYLDRALQIVKQ
ncbi:MAG: hypothetical protein ABL933_17410 [Methyloglobulus sp.]|nr:hypothetical protein [Methyloglobulus sp.]